MTSCESCTDACKIRGKFDIVFKTAAQDLSSFHKQRMNLDTKQFWQEFDVFYVHYQPCILDALEEVIIDSYWRGERMA